MRIELTQFLTDAELSIEQQLNISTECIKKIMNEGRPEIELPSFNPLVIDDKTWNLDELNLPGIS